MSCTCPKLFAATDPKCFVHGWAAFNPEQILECVIPDTHCLVTGHLCGTDTRPAGSPCPCAHCQLPEKEYIPVNVVEELLKAIEIVHGTQRRQYWTEFLSTLQPIPEPRKIIGRTKDGQVCHHTNTGGGNDYLSCLDCGYEWDYRKRGKFIYVVD